MDIKKFYSFHESHSHPITANEALLLNHPVQTHTSTKYK